MAGSNLVPTVESIYDDWSLTIEFIYMKITISSEERNLSW
jgi:hypothetical protein